jgi:hypothetical protein
VYLSEVGEMAKKLFSGHWVKKIVCHFPYCTFERDTTNLKGICVENVSSKISTHPNVHGNLRTRTKF